MRSLAFLEAARAARDNARVHLFLAKKYPDANWKHRHQREAHDCFERARWYLARERLWRSYDEAHKKVSNQ